MNSSLFEGVCTALVTPFGPDGVDLPMLDRLLERQLAAGVEAVVIAGTTGESATLTRKEKLVLFARAAETANGRCRVIAGTGSNDTETAASLSAEAAACGVDGLLCVTPYYNKCTQEGLYRHFMTILDRAALPLLLYNVPSRTGVRLEPETCARLAAHPNTAGLKEADPDVGRLLSLRALCGDRLPVYSGCDDRIVPFYAAGARGVVSVWSNVCPEDAVRLCALCAGGRYAEALDLQTASLPLIDALFRTVNPIPVKAAMRLLGYDCGPCRLPLTGLPEPEQERLRALLPES